MYTVCGDIVAVEFDIHLQIVRLIKKENVACSNIWCVVICAVNVESFSHVCMHLISLPTCNKRIIRFFFFRSVPSQDMIILHKQTFSATFVLLIIA